MAFTMRLVIFFSATLALALAAPRVSVRQAAGVTPLSPEEVPSPSRICTPRGGKCIGAPNRPFVQYRPCCDAGLVCATPKETDLWGDFCILESEAATDAEVDDDEADDEGNDEAEDEGNDEADDEGNDEADDEGDDEGDEGAASDEDSGANDSGDEGTDADVEASDSNADADTNSSSSDDDVDVDEEGPEATAGDTTSDGTGEDAETESTPEGEAEDDDDGSVCFDALSTVVTPTGPKRMAELTVGDLVQVGSGKYSPVFMFTHKVTGTYDFLEVRTAASTLRLTKGHYLYVNGELAAAKTVVKGDRLTLENGESAVVRSVNKVEAEGLYNPQTVHGDIVVNGVLASTYTTAVEPNVAHAILAPLRALYTITGLKINAFESDSALAAVAPRGASTI